MTVTELDDDATPEFKRQLLANLITTLEELNVEILPGEVDYLRDHYNF